MTAQEIATRPKQEVEEREQTRPGRTYVPEVDIYEDNDALYLWADLPGVAQDNVTVELHENVLTLEAEPILKDYQELSPVYTEYNIGRFLRRFTVPGRRFNQGAIKARMSNGVLEVRLPKAEVAKPRRIRVGS